MSAAHAIQVGGQLDWNGSKAEFIGGYCHTFNEQVAKVRYDAMKSRYDDNTVVNFDDHPRVRENRRRLDSRFREVLDNYDPARGIATAKELEHIYAEVLNQTFSVPNALRLFAVDGSVSPGATTHTVRRWYEAGTAAVYRAGQSIPMVGISRDEQTFNIRHYVNGHHVDYFSQLSLGRIGVNEAQEKIRVQRDAMTRFVNKATWEGLPEDGIYGVLTYPWLTKWVSSQVFNSAQTSTAMLRALHDIASYPSDTYKDVPAPNKMVVGHRLYNFLSQTRMSVDNPQTILQAFLSESMYITSVEGVSELSGAGPAGADGILAYRDDRLGISNVIVQGFTLLPIEVRGFESQQVGFMTHGGVIMREVMNNILVWVEGPYGLS